MRQHINHGVRVVLGVLICTLLALTAGGMVWTAGRSVPDATLAIMTGADPSFYRGDAISCSTLNKPAGQLSEDECNAQNEAESCYECTTSGESNSLSTDRAVGQYYKSGSTNCGTLLMGTCSFGECKDTMTVKDPATGMPKQCSSDMQNNNKQPTPPSP